MHARTAVVFAWAVVGITWSHGGKAQTFPRLLNQPQLRQVQPRQVQPNPVQPNRPQPGSPGAFQKEAAPNSKRPQIAFVCRPAHFYTVSGKPQCSVPAVNDLSRVRDPIVVIGTNLDGLTGANLQYAVQVNGQWVPNTAALRKYPIAPTASTATRVDFLIPDKVQVWGSATMVVVLTKGAQSAFAPVMVGQTPTIRKITSVEHVAVWSNNPGWFIGGIAGGRIQIHGSGFNEVPGPGGYWAVKGGYFGQGTPGSATNPLFSVVNLSEDGTYVELLLPKDCDQYGLLMLSTGASNGGTEGLILPDKPITVGCSKSIPGGTIQGLGPNGVISATPGSSVNIVGADLYFVSRVVDNQGRSYPFTTHGSGSGTSLTVTLPNAPGTWLQLYVQNSLYGPGAGLSNPVGVVQISQ